MLLEKVRQTIRKYGLFSVNDKVLIAFSGGADSTALLHVLRELQQEWSLTLVLGHFNHKIRKGADADEIFVRNTAEELSLPVYVGTEDVRAYSSANRLNQEEAGRQLRYAFLKKTALQTSCIKIATAHTANDQAETFFMRLLRGSGLAGLSGIYPVVDDLIVRPVIHAERKEVEVYIEENKLEFRVDESNFDRRFLRNRIRNELLPFIQKEFDPGIISRIGKVSSILQEDETVLRELAEKEARRAIIRKDGRVLLDCDTLSAMPIGLARRVARKYIAELKGDLRRISFEDIVSVLELGEGKESHLKKDLLLRREGGAVFCKPKVSPCSPYKVTWSGEKTLCIEEAGLCFSGMKTDMALTNFDDRRRACFDLRKLKFPLTVRSRCEGDRYQPLGAPGRKKLKEIMRARSIPIHDRDRIPVFLSAGEIIWVYALPVAEKFRITPRTKDVFVISLLEPAHM